MTFLSRCTLVFGLLLVSADATAADPPSAVGPVMKLLQSGRVPDSRLPAIVEIVGTRGNEHDLAFLFQQATQDKWPEELRMTAFRLLTDSAATRKVIPAGDLSPLTGIVQPDSKVSPNLKLAAVQFAGAARAKAATEALVALLKQEQLSPELQSAALKAYVDTVGKEALPIVEQVLASSAPASVRSQALTAQAEVDIEAAAQSAVRMLKTLPAGEDAGPIMDAFLARKNGPEVLAAAISKTPPQVDVAKLALRHLYAVGRSDEALSSALSKAAGINDTPEPVTPELIAGLVAEVEKSGDAARGEAVFRRQDLSCMKCHAVSAGGGQVGPDLSAVGSISPLDYLATSILNPDQAIKEAYITRVVATADGQVLQGIVVDRTSERLVLKDATGAVHTIALADIDDEVEGKSLMPKGLVKFMTRQELVDVITFLSQLGRPGDYAIRTVPRFQRYRVLAKAPSSLSGDVPNDEQFEAEILRATEWVPFYAKANGTVPLDEAQRAAGNPVVYLSTEFDVRTTGEIGLKVDASGPVSVWLDDDSIDTATGTISPEPGRHRLTLRVDVREWPEGSAGPIVELSKPQGSTAEFQVVDGA